MKSKVSLLSLALLAISFSVFAQEDDEKSKDNAVILRLGANFAKVSVPDNQSTDAHSLTTFQAGLFGDFSVTRFLYIQPGIVFSGKGSKLMSGNEEDANYFKATSNPYYIEVPLNLALKANFVGYRWFVAAGPYAAMGIAGKNKMEGKLLGVAFESEDKIEFSNDDPSTSFEEGAGLGILKKFDYGVNGSFGIEGRKALISVNYGYGLAKLQSGADSEDGEGNKHRVLSVTLGFRF